MTDTALPTSATYYLCRQGQNTLELLLCKVRVKLLTDTGKPITKERVLLAGPDKKVRQATTDDAGIAEFKDLPASPFSRCFVVLPDVLESWNDRDDAKQIVVYPKPKQNQSVKVQKVPLSTEIDEPSDFIGMLQFFNKDQLDAFVGGGDKDRPYRSKDKMKHCVFSRKNTAEDDGTPDLIYVNSLTMMEKYRHFRDAFQTNDAKYCTAKYSSYTGKNAIGFHKTLRRWNWAQGAVCNEFANFFLSFWFNRNSAHNKPIVYLDFYRMMEIFGSTISQNTETGNQKMRGYNDYCTPIECPTGMVAKELDHRSNRKLKTIKLRRTADGDSVDDFDKEAMRFTNATLQNALGMFSIYSVTDGDATPTGDQVDHHGGIIIKSEFPEDPTAPDSPNGPDARLMKLAADGNMKPYFGYNGKLYRYPSKQQKPSTNNHHKALTDENLPAAKIAFTLTPISEKDYVDPANRKHFHIRIWALKPLRAGGYAPGDTGGSYTPEPDLGDPDTITPMVHHSLPRFIHWVDDAPTITVINDIKPLQQFLAISP